MTQAQLAERSGVPRSHLGKIERGVIDDPRPDTLRRLAAALDLPSVLELTLGERCFTPRVREGAPSERETYRALLELMGYWHSEDAVPQESWPALEPEVAPNVPASGPISGENDPQAPEEHQLVTSGAGGL